MPAIVIPTFGGEVPRTTPRLLENTQASRAVNCQLQRGALEAMRGPLKVHDLDKPAGTIFKHNVDGWLSWPGVVNVVKSAVVDVVGDAPLGHLFITGDRPYPTQYFAGGDVYRLGIPRPDTAPTVTIQKGAALRTVKAYAFGADSEAEIPPRYGYEDMMSEVKDGNVRVSTFAESTDGAENLTLDIAAVLAAKAKQMNASSAEGRTNWTEADAAVAIAKAGLSVSEWWNAYGKSESVCPWASPQACQDAGYTYYADESTITTDSGINRSSSYCYTLVQSLGGGIFQQESAPSPASAVVDVMDGDGVLVSGFKIPTDGGLNITHIRIYRTVSGLSSSEFHFLEELPVPAASHLDTASDLDVASKEILATTTWDCIPDDAQGLIHADNGLYVCFRGNELLISEPFYAYVFPTGYRLSTEDPIVALGHVDGTIVVLTTGRPYLVAGAEPSSMQITHLPIEHSCVSARSVGSVPGGVMYASPDGLMLFSANEQTLVTGQSFTREQWQALGPDKLLGAVHDSRYVGFFEGTNQGFLFSLGAKDIIRMELPDGWVVRDVYHHSNDDCIYLSVDTPEGSAVYQLEAGDPMPYIWRSKPFFVSALTGMSALRLEGEQSATNAVMARVFGPDEKRARATLRLADTRAKRLPTARAEKMWSVELQGKATVYEVRMGGSVEGVEYGV